MNDKLKRAEQRRKEEEERRRTELEAKQRLKDDRAKAVKLQQAAGSGAPAAAKTEAVLKAAPLPVKEALQPAAAAAAPPPPPLQAKSTNVPPAASAASSSATGLVKKGTTVAATVPPPPPQQQQPMPGFAVMGLAVSSSAAKARGSQNNAPTPKLLRAPAAASQYPPLTPAELVSVHSEDCLICPILLFLMLSYCIPFSIVFLARAFFEIIDSVFHAVPPHCPHRPSLSTLSHHRPRRQSTSRS